MITIKKKDCAGVAVSICGNAGVVRIEFEPCQLMRGIVAHPSQARRLAKEIEAAAEEAEQSVEARP
jgi:hypothetical protein